MPFGSAPTVIWEEVGRGVNFWAGIIIERNKDAAQRRIYRR
jgi:hypothetical protein